MCLLHGIILDGNTTLFMIFSVIYYFCEGSNCILCILFADICNFLKCVQIYIMTSRVALLGYSRWQFCVLACKRKMFSSILNAKGHLCTLQSIGRPLRNTCLSLHLMTLLNILMPRYQYMDLNTKCHEVTNNDEVVDRQCNLTYTSKHGN